MTQQTTVKPITLKIDRDTWEQFKVIVPRTITLNDQVVELIRNHIKQKEVQ